MPFKTEIKQFNTLTKRFQRDSAKIVNEIKVRVQEGGLTKMELQKLIESFGKFELFFLTLTECSEPHLSGWEDRLFEAINQLDRFLSNLEPVKSNSNNQSDFILGT